MINTFWLDIRRKRIAEVLEDARCELEELNESGDLEERLEAASRVAELERELAITDGLIKEASAT